MNIRGSVGRPLPPHALLRFVLRMRRYVRSASRSTGIPAFPAIAAVAWGLILLGVVGSVVATDGDPGPGKAPDAASEEATDTDTKPDAVGADKGMATDGSGGALTVFGSWGRAVSINGSRIIDIQTAGVRWSHRWKPGGKGLLRGNPTISIELIPTMRFDQRPNARAPAFNLFYEHRLAPSARLHPVIRAGAGVLYANREVPPGETRHNFSVIVGLGLDIDISSMFQIAPEYRLHHVSNANTGPVNPGINAHTLVVGLTFKL